ncbi:MAG: LuxR C-terminal-related transcriptional regulator [Cocleimonas sp.]
MPNKSSTLISSLLNTKQTLSSLMTQSNKLAKLTGDSCLIGQQLKSVLFVCNSEIMVTAFTQIVKGINPSVNLETVPISLYEASLSDDSASDNTLSDKKDKPFNYDVAILILSDTADINLVAGLEETKKSSKVFVIAPQSFKLATLNRIKASIFVSLESNANEIRESFLRGIQGEKFNQGFNSKIDERFSHLTPRQKEVLELLRAGKCNKEISRDLDISIGTTKTHCGAIFKALGVTSRIQAMHILEA